MKVHMLTIRRAVVAAATLLGASSAFAVLPQQGMWTIGSEVNGKPGRGIQIDQQGGQFLIVTYVGYRDDGSATFMQASGKIESGKNFTGDLTEYKNGRSLGGSARDGEAAHTVGQVAIQFDTPTSGTITLPGEAPQSFSRYQYENHLSRLNNSFLTQIYEYMFLARTDVTVSIKASANQFYMREQYGVAQNAPTCEYTGDLRPAGDAFSSKGTIKCTDPEQGFRRADFYRFNELRVDAHGTLSGRIFTWGDGLLLPGDTPIETIRYLNGVCISTGPLFDRTPRCRAEELGLTRDDQQE